MLSACGCCGVREFEMGGTKTSEFHLEQLSFLQLNENQREDYFQIPELYRKAASVYQAQDGRLYHLHPEFVKDEAVKICQTCRKSLTKEKLPKFSLAAGVDFGLIGRLSLPPPTLVEELLISRSRIFVSLVKLVGPTAAQRQLAKQKSHVITFQAPEGPTKLAELQRLNSSHNRDVYPRVENLQEHIGVFFLGSRLQYAAFVPFREVQELQVRVEVVYRYLHLLKCINPLYSEILIDESPAMKSALEEITSVLLDVDAVGSTVIMQDKMDLENEKVANPQDCNAEKELEEADPIFTANLHLQFSFVSRSSPTDRDPEQSARFALQG